MDGQAKGTQEKKQSRHVHVTIRARPGDEAGTGMKGNARGGGRTLGDGYREEREFPQVRDAGVCGEVAELELGIGMTRAVVVLVAQGDEMM
jgi:hypothetical protein